MSASSSASVKWTVSNSEPIIKWPAVNTIQQTANLDLIVGQAQNGHYYCPGSGFKKLGLIERIIRAVFSCVFSCIYSTQDKCISLSLMERKNAFEWLIAKPDRAFSLKFQDQMSTLLPKGFIISQFLSSISNPRLEKELNSTNAVAKQLLFHQNRIFLIDRVQSAEASDVSKANSKLIHWGIDNTTTNYYTLKLIFTDGKFKYVTFEPSATIKDLQGFLEQTLQNNDDESGMKNDHESGMKSEWSVESVDYNGAEAERISLDLNADLVIADRMAALQKILYGSQIPNIPNYNGVNQATVQRPNISLVNPARPLVRQNTGAALSDVSTSAAATNEDPSDDIRISVAQRKSTISKNKASASASAAAARSILIVEPKSNG